MATYTVKKGDNLTHIARRFGIGSWRELYNHLRNAEFKRKRPNPNLIFPGDLLFIPGDDPGQQVIDLGETRIVVPLEDKKIQDLTKEEKDQALEAVVDALPPDLKAIAQDILSLGSLALTVAQLMTVCEVLSVGAWAIASPVAVTVRAILGFVQAWEVNKKMYGYRACAYSVTAWAFGEPKPKGSPEMLRRYRRSSASHRVIQQRERAWRDAATKTWNGLEAEYKKRQLEKAQWQTILKIVGLRNKRHSGSPKQKLCHAMLMEFEGEFRGINRSSWQDGYNVLYPK